MIKMNADATFEWCEIGSGSPILIIDNALEDPDRVRQHAWQSRFHLPELPREYYPGWKTSAAMPGKHHLSRASVGVFSSPLARRLAAAIVDREAHFVFRFFGFWFEQDHGGAAWIHRSTFR